MFTVCSKCNLRLTVTANDLRAAQGYVRCGRCHNVFNALAGLADDPARTAEQGAAADTQTRLAITPPPPEPELATPQAATELKQTDTSDDSDTSLEFNPASTNINEVFIEAAPGDRTGTFESIVLVTEEPAAPATSPVPDEPPATEAPAATTVAAAATTPLPEPAPETPAPEPEAAESAPAETTAPEPEVLQTVTPESEAAGPEPAVPEAVEFEALEPEVAVAAGAGAHTPITAPTPPAPAGEPPLEETVFLDASAANEILRALETPAAPILPEHPPPRIPDWAMPAAAAGLALCLIGQLVHHYRGELADTSLLRRPLTALYAALGQPLEPRWDIGNYEIRQLGATTDGAAAGDLVVRASISNRAARDQPLPLLRVVMQDRFGNRVAARDLKPAEYLGPGAPQVSLMAPGQRVDLQVAFQDPGQAATGFEIDACMAAHDHTVTCANDPGTR